MLDNSHVLNHLWDVQHFSKCNCNVQIETLHRLHIIRYKRPIGKNVRPSQFFNPTDCIYTVYTFPKIGLKPISTQISTRFQQTDVLKTNILITK